MVTSKYFAYFISISSLALKKKENKGCFGNFNMSHLFNIFFEKIRKCGQEKQIIIQFLAHLITKCSWWAIVVSGCPSCVVRQQLMFTL